MNRNHPFIAFLKEIGILAVIALIVVAAWVLSASLAVHGAEPHRKPTITIAIDDSPHSQMLHHELTRNWTRPNPCIALTHRQQNDARIVGYSMRALQHQLNWTFDVRFVDRDAVPLSAVNVGGGRVRNQLPAIRINGGAWESLDARAFTFETRPLLTLDWIRQKYVALYDRNATPDLLSNWGCSEEGFSGVSPTDIPAPWDPPRLTASTDVGADK